MIGDDLFPFPEPTFIFVQDVLVMPLESLVRVVDGRGNHDYELPATLPPTIKGYLTSFNPTEDSAAYSLREVIDAVLLLPDGIAVDQGWIVASFDPQVKPRLQGWYIVHSVRPTLVHQRVLCKRNTKQWAEYQNA